MKLIPLTQGQFAKVDDSDFDWLNQWKWFAQRVPRANIFYACRATARDVNGKQQRIYMHREIAAKAGIPEVDHEDHDGLNNQRYNLRPATVAQNQQNRFKRPGCVTPFIGVTSGVIRCPKWRASIRVKGKAKHLGYFETPELAARARDAAAIKYFGPFARLNFPQDYGATR